MLERVVLMTITMWPFSEEEEGGGVLGDSGHICCCYAELQKTNAGGDGTPDVLRPPEQPVPNEDYDMTWFPYQTPVK